MYESPRPSPQIYSDTDLSDEEIELIVSQLRRLTRQAKLEYSLSVGALIIHNFYGGDTDTWRHRGAKSASFRRLAQHPGLPMSAGSLYRCVAVFELCERLNAPARWSYLGTSHLRIVLGLPIELQERLLASANKHRWSVKQLHDIVQSERATRTTRGGRRAKAPLFRNLERIRKFLADQRNLTCSQASLSDDDRERIRCMLEEVRDGLDAISSTFSNQGAEHRM